MSTTNSLFTSIQQSFSQLEVQAKTDLATPLNQALTSLINTPTTQNIIAQGPVIGVQITALAPILEGQGIKDFATNLQTWLNTNSAIATSAARASIPPVPTPAEPPATSSTPISTPAA